MNSTHWIIKISHLLGKNGTSEGNLEIIVIIKFYFYRKRQRSANSMDGCGHAGSLYRDKGCPARSKEFLANMMYTPELASITLSCFLPCWKTKNRGYYKTITLQLCQAPVFFSQDPPFPSQTSPKMYQNSPFQNHHLTHTLLTLRSTLIKKNYNFNYRLTDNKHIIYLQIQSMVQK